MLLLLGAEDDHVGEIAARLGEFLVVARVLAEDAAGGEDGFDGVDDDAGWWEGEVACVVLLSGVLVERGKEGRVGKGGRTMATTPFGLSRVLRFCRNSRVKRAMGSAPPVKTSWMM
jgi:hypothetical protein